MAQSSMSPATMVFSMANSLRTGRAPGRPRQTGQVRVLGGWPYWAGQAQNIFVRVRIWQWTSRPMEGMSFMGGVFKKLKS